MRDRYFAGDAYDFRAHVLPGIAMRMANAGAINDAISLAQLNVDAYPDIPSAKQVWVALKLEAMIDADGVDARLDRRHLTLADLRRQVDVAAGDR